MNFFLDKRHLGLLAVLGLAVLSWWWQQQQIEIGRQPGESDGQLVDYSLKGFDVTAMDDTGKPRHRLNAETLIHFAEADYAEIKAPHLEMYGRDGKTVRLNADMALVYQGGDQVLFSGAVQIKQLDEQDQQTLEVLTRDVWFYADQELAETSEKVTLKDAIGVTTAEGLKVDMKAGKLQLLAAVRGRYVVQ